MCALGSEASYFRDDEWWVEGFGALVKLEQDGFPDGIISVEVCKTCGILVILG